MTIPYGLSEAGFIPKPYETIKEEIDSQLVEALTAPGAEKLNTKTGVVRQLVDPFASKARELWELAQAVHGAFDRDNASGAALDAVGTMTGRDRLPATRGTVPLTLTLDAGVTVPAGSIASVGGSPTSRWLTRSSVTSASAGSYVVDAVCESAGPIAAAATTIDTIETPVAGWSAVTNAEDAVQGALEESDAAYRAAQEFELAAPGTSPVDALRADLLRLLDEHDIAGGSITVDHNPGDEENADGLPPHSVEVIVYDGTSDGSAIADADIAQRIWESVAGGIDTHGSIETTATDSVGEQQTIRFSRPVEVLVYVSVDANVATSRGWDTTSGAAQVKAAIAAFGRSTFRVGDDVVRFRLMSSAFPVPGIIDVTGFRLGRAPSPSGTINLVIDRRELAAFDTSRIVVTPTTVTPP